MEKPKVIKKMTKNGYFMDETNQWWTMKGKSWMRVSREEGEQAEIDDASFKLDITWEQLR